MRQASALYALTPIERVFEPPLKAIPTPKPPTTKAATSNEIR